MQTFDGNGMNGDIEKRMAAYAAMSESALVGELKREADALKKQGLLDIGRLTDFASAAAPYMTADQLRRMRELIDALR